MKEEEDVFSAPIFLPALDSPMPITCQQPLNQLSREEFGRLSYDLMADVFAIRNELGRFFDEKHYKQALALRRRDVILEVPVRVNHQTFSKTYFLDVLLAAGAIIEFKAFKLTALVSHISQQRFAHHARQLVRHTELDALLWANLGRHEITFSCLQSEN